MDSATGELNILDDNLICESKGGAVGNEEIQCWESDKGDSSVIMNFKGVKSIGRGSRRRMLPSGDKSGRELSDSTPPLQFNYIKADLNVSEF